MIINKDSWHYKWWVSTYEQMWDVPERTNLCSYVQRIFWFSLWRGIILALILATMGNLLRMLVGAIIHHPWVVFLVVLAIILTVASIVALVMWREGRDHLHAGREPGIVYQWISAKKQKVCPIITFEGNRNT